MKAGFANFEGYGVKKHVWNCLSIFVSSCWSIIEREDM